MTDIGSLAGSHADAVEALRRSYRAIPPGDTVRLAKKTSNLFRPRTEGHAGGLDVSALSGVISIDEVGRTADVQGMCTYERLVEQTLPLGLMPLVVPQLRTITLGGAVTGLGIESSSFRNGLPHESVLEADILTGDGELLTISPDQHPDLFAGFPNSYGSLGYAVRLKIELEPVSPYVALRHVRFDSPQQLCAAVAEISDTRSFDGEPVDFLDGVMFALDECYLSLGRWSQVVVGTDDGRASDYTGAQIYYRSIRHRSRDCLSVLDYLWRWDTDWFWCSAAFGAQNKAVRKLWPAKYRRSDVYHRMVGLEHRFGVAARIDKLRGRPARERVVQDVEVPLAETPDFLAWFAENVGMSPVWLCPLRLREPGGAGTARHWPLYPLAEQTYVNVGFWGMVPIEPGRADGDVNRAVETAVHERAGHKSLYSDAYYDRATFDATYGGPTYAELKKRYDPDHRLTGLYEKAVGRK